MIQLNRLNSPNIASIVYSFVCLSILLIGFYLRVYQLDGAAYWIDEAFSIEAATHYLNSQSDPSIRAVLYRRILAMTISIFGESPITTRLPTAIVSMVGVIAVGLICNRRFGRLATLLALCIMAFGYWHIAWARQVREYAWLMSLFWLGVYFFDLKYLSKARLERSIGLLKPVLILAFLTFILAALNPLGLLFLPTGLLALIFSKQSIKERVFAPKGFSILAVLTLLFITLLSFYWPWGIGFKTIYLEFMLGEYSLLMLLSLSVLLCLRCSLNRPFLVWITLSMAAGFLIIASMLPLTNLRYIYFLTPVFAILVASGLSQFGRPIKMLLCVLVLAGLFYSGTLIIQPSKNYALESIKAESGFTFYTPQPKFDIAYNYINNRLKGKDLLTPYPAISRRYRNTDDTMVIDAKVSFRSEVSKRELATEFYTGIPFADGQSLFKLAKQTGEVYILIDQMALERVDQVTQIIILEHAELVRTWRKPPNSDLFLYRVTHDR